MPFTLDTLEAFVSSAHYDSATADLIAAQIPTLKAATGAPGELISPGVRRIHGNLCNVHGRYGPCDKALSGKKKPRKGRKPAKPKQTPAQRAQAHQQQRDQNASDVAKRMADTDTGLSPSGSAALLAFAHGTQPSAAAGEQLAQMGLAERASDGSYRMTATAHGVVSAMQAGDYQRAVDGISRGTDTAGRRTQQQTARATRQQEAATRRAQAAATRQQHAAARLARGAASAAKKPAKAASGGSKKPSAQAKPAKPRPFKRIARSQAPKGPSLSPFKPKPAPKPEKPKPAPKAPAKQIAPALQTAAQALSDGKQLSDADAMALVRNGLARLTKDGDLILTAAGLRATMKSFKVFKDATGADRWVAQSSTAFQDRDREIVSTKALADDCAFADETGSYGPLRWWHTPGLDLGDCDFNAMHGRILIESGTFRSPAIAQKVAEHAADLEISLGFLHLPSEPDADGVFHHIRRFERSLVPRGKASNRFTAFTVKETRMFDPTKVAALKSLGFSDDDIAGLQATAAATEKAATDQGVAFKADEPELPDIIVNGVTYKAFPPAKPDEGSPEEEAAESPEEEAAEPDAMGEPVDETALTLSQGDLAAISDAIQSAVSQVMGALDLEKKVAGHVQGMLAPFQATKDAEAAEVKEQVGALSTAVKGLDIKLAELTGDQPARPYRATESAKSAIITDPKLLEAAQKAAGAGPFDDIIQGLGLARP